MDKNTLPHVFTVKEVAEYLKVDEPAVIQEMEVGNLRGFKVGEQWRCAVDDLLKYVRGGEPSVNSVETPPTKMQTLPVNSPTRQRSWSYVETGPFAFNWPKKGGGSKPERYDRGVEATAKVGGAEYTFKIGFGSRASSGRIRPRVTVWLGNRALVEFAGGNHYEKDGLLAGVIRLKNGRQLVTQRIPEEYERFRIQRYNEVVKGPRASRGMAVIVHKDDLGSMLEHAIIRATWKEII